MKKILLSLALFGALNSAFAVFPLYEPFADATASGGTSYSTGSLMAGQTNAAGDSWYGTGTTTAGAPVSITNFSLSYPGLPASSGNALWLKNANGPGGRMFISTNTSGFLLTTTAGAVEAKVYYSLIFQVRDLTALSTSGDYNIGFNNQGAIGPQTGQPGIQGGRLYLKKVGSNYQVGVSKNDNVVAYDPTLRSTSDVLFVVADYEIYTNSTTDDNVRLWVNPDPATFGVENQPLETTNILGAQADLPSILSSFVLLDRTASNPNALIVDEVRVGRTWAFVTGGPEVTVPPVASTNLNYSSNFTLTVSAKSGGPSALAYRWQRDGTNLPDGGNVSGSATAGLTVSSVAAADAGAYSVVVSNATGRATSSVATVSVADPYIARQPTNQVVTPASTAHFSVGAIGTATLKYQWQKDDVPLPNGGNISGSSTANLTVANVSPADEATYSCLVTNGLGSFAVSSGATLMLVDPGIVSQPPSVTTNYGATAVLSLVAIGTAPLAYQWQKDGVDLTNGPSVSGATVSGATSSNLTLSGVAYLDSGSYSAYVTNSIGGWVGSDPALLVVNDPYIVTQPASQTNLPGTTASFTVAANGTAPLAYSWYKNDLQLSDGGNISGSTNISLTLSNVSNADIGIYNAVVSGGSGSNAVSAAAVLKVLSTTPGQPLYWDGNGTTAGAGDTPAGSWETNYFWSTDPGGGVTPGAWIDGSVAVFSAGSDAVNAFTVTVSSTQSAAGLKFEEGTITLNGGVIELSGAATLDVADGLTATLTTAISGSSGLTKTGGGKYRPNVGNAYTGGTRIYQGAISIQGNDRLGPNPASLDPANIILDGGILQSTAATTVTLNANRGITLGTNGGTIDCTLNGGTLDVQGPIRGATNLTKIGPDKLTLTASNSFSGGLIFNEGRINFNNNGGAGTGLITVNPGATDFDSTANGIVLSNSIFLNTGANPRIYANAAANGLNLAGAISGPGALTRDDTGQGTIALSGPNTFTGGVTLKNRTLSLAHKQALGTGPLTIDLATSANAPTLQSFANLTGANALTNPVIANMDFALAGTNHIELAGPITFGPTTRTITVSGTGSRILSGVISGDPGVGLTKEGTSTLTLSGANTYSGTTTVNAGTLLVNNTSASGTGAGAVSVNTGSTLGGNGTIAGAVAVSSANISAGNSAGKLTLQAGLDLTSGGTNVWELAAPKDDSTGIAGTDFDLLAVSGGTLNLNGGTLVIRFTGAATAPDVTNSFWQTAHTWTIIGLSGSASNPGASIFAGVLNGSYPAGAFTTEAAGDGSIQLKFMPVPAIQTISATTGSATISWNTVSAVNYQVLYNTNLNTTNWLLLTNVTGTGSLMSITDSHASDPQRFYRLAIP